MNNKIILRAMVFFLCFSMLFGTIECVNISVFADENTKLFAEKYEGDYYKTKFTDLFDNSLLEAQSEDISIEKNEKYEGLILSGASKSILNKKVLVKKTFNFDEGAVGRFSVDAVTQKSDATEIAFYLDDNAEPFTTFSLGKQKKANKWDYYYDKTANISSLKLTGEHTVSFAVTSNKQKAVKVFLRSIEFAKSTIPTLYFNLDESQGTVEAMNNSFDHSEECYGSMSIEVPDGYKSVDTGKKLSGGTYDLEYIRGRGNSTWDTDKKPYKIKLDKKADLLGLGKNKHWVLLANYYDNSLLRNKMTYYLGQQLGMEFTPDSEPVEVVINGIYYGSYFLCEQIRIGKDRVDIDDLEDNDETIHSTDPAIISGGYLLAMCPSEEDESRIINTTRGNSFLIERPEFEDYYNKAQYDYINDYMQRVEDALYSKNLKNDKGEKYSDLLDVRSAAYYYLMQDFSLNGDGYISTSTYLYKKRNGKLYWGPLWDFDYVAWGSTEYHEFTTDGWMHNEQNWIRQLFNDEEFVTELKSAYNNLKDKITAMLADGGMLDKYYDNLKTSASYNFEKYGMTDLDYNNSEDDNNKKIVLTYEQELERLKSWVSQRLKWVDENIVNVKANKLCTLTYKVDNKVYATDEVYSRNNSTLPKAPTKKGYLFKCWNTAYTLSYDEYISYFGYPEDMSDEEIEDLKKYGYTYEGPFSPETETVSKDLTLTAEFIKESDAKKVKKIVFPYKQYNIGLYEDSLYLSHDITPFDASEIPLTWTSSDESIATVSDGFVKFLKAGKVTITAEGFGGAKATCVVNIVTEYPEDFVYTQRYYNGDETIVIKKGEYKMLDYNVDYPDGMFNDETIITPIMDSTSVEVGNIGMIYGASAGTSIIRVSNGDYISYVKVIVVDKNDVKKGATYTVNNLKYKVLSKTRVACVGAKKSKANVKIPSTVKIKKKTFKVTEIASNAFYKDKKLKKLTIGNNVKFVRTSAFEACKNLKSVTVGKKAQVIYKNAFKNCKKLSAITLKQNYIKIYKSAFSGIAKNAKFKVPKNSKKYYEVVLKGKNISE